MFTFWYMNHDLDDVVVCGSFYKIISAFSHKRVFFCLLYFCEFDTPVVEGGSRQGAVVKLHPPL